MTVDYGARISTSAHSLLSLETKVRNVFPGGAYKVAQTIFGLLEDEGIVIPEELKYFPYRATFDFECYFKKKTSTPETQQS